MSTNSIDDMVRRAMSEVRRGVPDSLPVTRQLVDGLERHAEDGMNGVLGALPGLTISAVRTLEERVARLEAAHAATVGSDEPTT